ncbi:hypothetical protein RKE38_11890 [Phycicoccus sp. M110.8]|uniref:hypothetical protein n=1 Tax=Phycicoccus sp. M110.8 TaxID=3075433 RepID=UPI0028FD5CA2|nr:hypothetical protein [Phycicoccus sp. M110.8]MDU0314391.1 hypothetical protein [Phycicoccus sp. M110.8]
MGDRGAAGGAVLAVLVAVTGCTQPTEAGSSAASSASSAHAQPAAPDSAPSAASGSASSPGTAATAPDQRFDTADARVVATLGQRQADTMIGEPVTSGLGPIDLCDGVSPFVPASTRAWFATSTVPDDEQLHLRDRVTKLVTASNAAIVLDDSPSAASSMDERLRRWAACRSDHDNRSPVSLSVPGVASLAAWHTTDADADRAGRHEVMGGARVGNLLLLCDMVGPSAGPVSKAVRSCLSDMAAGATLAHRPATSATPLTTKAVVAGLASTTWDVTLRYAVSTPCPKDRRSFVAAGAAAGEVTVARKTGADRSSVPDTVGIVNLERVASPSAAATRLAAERWHLAGCSGTFSSQVGAYTAKGKVDRVSPVRVGDGGTAIAYHQSWNGGRPEYQYEVVFAVGPYIAHVIGFGSRSQVSSRALALAKALTDRIRASG